MQPMRFNQVAFICSLMCGNILSDYSIVDNLFTAGVVKGGKGGERI